jgi:quinol monooxygenase YgiN
MFVRLVRFSFGPGKPDKAQALADELVPLISSQPGCQRVSVFGDESDGECGVFVLWDTQDHADAASEVVRPKLNEHLAGNVQAPPDARLFTVLATK